MYIRGLLLEGLKEGPSRRRSREQGAGTGNSHICIGASRLCSSSGWSLNNSVVLEVTKHLGEKDLLTLGPKRGVTRGWLMGGGKGGMELSLSSALQATSVPASLLQSLRALDQELGEDTEREALDGVVDSLVEWFLLESRAPRTGDGASVVLLAGCFFQEHEKFV